MGKSSNYIGMLKRDLINFLDFFTRIHYEKFHDVL